MIGASRIGSDVPRRREKNTAASAASTLPSVRAQVYKTMRTAQIWFPFLADVKASGQDSWRRLLRRPHESDFELFRRFSVRSPLVVDVGANRGQSISSFVVTCVAPRIVAFEPMAVLAERLVARRDDAVERIEQCALGSVRAEVVLHIPVYNGYVFDGLASLDEDEAHWLNGDRMFGFDPAKLSLRRETVQVRRLDEFDLAPDVIKIDVQGTEADVIDGARRTLERSRPVLLLEAPSAQLVDRLDAMGFRSFALRDGTLVPDAQGDPNTFFMTPERLDQFRSTSG